MCLNKRGKKTLSLTDVSFKVRFNNTGKIQQFRNQSICLTVGFDFHYLQYSVQFGLKEISETRQGKGARDRGRKRQNIK